jgi:hypothetical protein
MRLRPTKSSGFFSSFASLGRMNCQAPIFSGSSCTQVHAGLFCIRPMTAQVPFPGMDEHFYPDDGRVGIDLLPPDNQLVVNLTAAENDFFGRC